MSFFSKQPSESESLLDKAEAGECASEAESKRPALKQMLGGVVLVALALGAAASVDRGAASQIQPVSSSLGITYRTAGQVQDTFYGLIGRVPEMQEEQQQREERLT